MSVMKETKKQKSKCIWVFEADAMRGEPITVTAEMPLWQAKELNI